jgi:hypothetical protein
MPFLLDDEWARRLPKMWRWMRNFRIEGAGVSAKNTDETFTASITRQPATNPTTIAPLIRLKVKAGGAAPESNNKLVLAHTWDGTNEGTADIPVRVIIAHAAGETLFATRCRSGTDQTYDSSPVVWQEVIAQPGILFAVTLSQTGGSNGNKTTAASWTYTVTSLAGVQLGTSKSPEWPRPNGTMTAATKGLAYYDNDGALVLSVAFEQPGSGGCS